MSRALRAETPVLACWDGSDTYRCRGPDRLPGPVRPRSTAPTAMPGRRIRSSALLPGAARPGPGQQRRHPGSACVIRNALRGPGQGARIVRLSGAEVPMGSLLSVIAVKVAANAPAAVEGAAGKVRTERPPMTAVDGENDAVTPPGRPLTLSGHRRAVQIGRGPERDGDPGSVTCPDRDRRRAEPHCVVAVRRRRGVQARDVRGSGSLAGERRRRPAGGHQQCRRHKRRFEQRSGVNAKHCSPPGMSGDSASSRSRCPAPGYRV